MVATACAIAAAWTWSIAGAHVARAQTTPDSETYKSVFSGWKLWHSYCFRCHGMHAVGPTTLGPSIIEPNAKLTLPQFVAKIKTGNTNTHTTAPGLKTLLDRQISDIYAYVEARADKVLPPGRPDAVGPNGGHWVPPGNWPKKN